MSEDPSLPVALRADPTEVLAAAVTLLRTKVPCAVATVLARRGSTPATPGQKLLLGADGSCLGTVGGGAFEREVILTLREILGGLRDGNPSPTTRTIALTQGLGMCCGGSVEVLFEPLAVARDVGLVGAGHIATALAPLLVSLGFAVQVADDREAFADPARIPEARVLAGSHEVLGEGVSRDGALLVMTHDHGLDQEAIAWALREGFAFVGGVGSRAKSLRTRARLEARGFAAADIARVRMPLGVELGARTPAEIAVSIAAELIAWRRGHALAEPASVVAPRRISRVP